MCIFTTSCIGLKDRTVDVYKQTDFLVDKSVFEKTTPGDRVYITIPANNPERPKATTKNYMGTNGATTDVVFDENGTVTSIIADCPEQHEKQMFDIKYQHEEKSKEIESKANIELASTIGKWTAITLVPSFFFFATAWFFRGYFKDKTI